MSDRIPFFLSEAQLALYLPAADGLPTGPALWCGGFANRLKLELGYEEVVIRGSGDAYGTAHHVDESHGIQLGQTWLVQLPSLADWKPVRNQPYVLQIVWSSGPNQLQRTYYGVTWRTLTWDAANPNQFLMEQSLRAQYYTTSAGPAGIAPGVVIGLPAAGASAPVIFMREAPLLAGGYLLGFYQWPGTVILVRAKAIGWAPQTAPVVLGLELNGTLTGDTLTLLVGTANTEVSAAITLSGTVAAGTVARWKVVSAPAPADSAWGVTVQLAVA